jgi:hypothetical protein
MVSALIINPLIHWGAYCIHPTHFRGQYQIEPLVYYNCIKRSGVIYVAQQCTSLKVMIIVDPIKNTVHYNSQQI